MTIPSCCPKLSEHYCPSRRLKPDLDINLLGSRARGLNRPERSPIVYATTNRINKASLITEKFVIISNSQIIDTLVLVCGPSGAGKSTFIELLQSRKLSKNVLEKLPPDAAKWPLVDGNDILKLGTKVDDSLSQGPRIDGILLHYDFVHILRIGYGQSYEADPFYEFFDMSEKVIVCDIRPDRERLIHQYEDRLNRQNLKKGALRLFWKKKVHQPLRLLRHLVSKTHHADKRDLYDSKRWLTECYAQWDAFLEEKVLHRQGAELIRIVPGEEKNDLHFRIKTNKRQPH